MNKNPSPDRAAGQESPATATAGKVAWLSRQKKETEISKEIEIRLDDLYAPVSFGGGGGGGGGGGRGSSRNLKGRNLGPPPSFHKNRPRGSYDFNNSGTVLDELGAVAALGAIATSPINAGSALAAFSVVASYGSTLDNSPPGQGSRGRNNPR